MRPTLLLTAALIFAAGGAFAQTPLTGTTGAPGAPNAAPPAAAAPAATAPATARAATPHARAHRTLEQRFADANTTGDGHLTLEQARSKMPSVARDFAAIDTENHGYVTLDQIREHTRQVRATRREQRRAAAVTAKPQ